MRSKGRVIALSFSMFVSLFACECKNVHVERIRNVYSHFIMKTYVYLTNKSCMNSCGSKLVLSVQIIKHFLFQIEHSPHRAFLKTAHGYVSALLGTSFS